MSEKIDRRQFNVPPNARTPMKPEDERSRPYQFRLNPDDATERALRDYIREEQYKGRTLRQIVLDLYEEHVGRQTTEIDQQDYHEMLNAIRWIAEQIELGNSPRTGKASGGKRTKLPELPDNVNSLFNRLKTKGASAQALQIDEDD